jgi:hypothetical protein
VADSEPEPVEPKPEEPEQVEPEPLRLETVTAFLQQAQALAKYHTDRGDTFERRAAILLGFSPFVLALIVAAIHPITQIKDWRWEYPLLGLLVLTVAAFMWAAWDALQALRVSEHIYGDEDQVSDEWESYKTNRFRLPEEVTGLWVNHLLQRDADGVSSVASIGLAATSRGQHLKSAFVRFYIGIAGVVLLGIITLYAIGVQ